MISNPFSSTVAQAMQQANVVMVMAARIDFASGTSYVHTGVGEILIDGQVFTGLGALSDVGTVKEENTTSAVQMTMTLSGLDQYMLSIGMNENVVNKKITVYIAVLNEDHTAVAWNVLFKGTITGSQMVLGDNSAINYTVSNVFEKWSKGRPHRYTDESHRKRHAGDRFFRYISQMAERSLYWGSKKDAPGFRYDK